jgi:hypothetical protein
MPRLKIMVDDGAGSWVEVNQVRVVYEADEEDPDDNYQIQHNFTSEGVIRDVINAKGEVAATSSTMYDDLLSEMFETYD